MSEYDVAIVGTGPRDEGSTSEGGRPADEHALAYGDVAGRRLVACVDRNRENAAAFAARHGVPADAVFEDYRAMLEAADPDVVGLRGPVATRAEIAIDVAERAGPKAIHCARPLARTWTGARRAVAACRTAGVALSVNHTHRLGDLFRDAKALLDDGAIGDLERIECDWGTTRGEAIHAVDACHFFNDDRAVDRVLAQNEASESCAAAGDSSAGDSSGGGDRFASWQYENGVRGLAGSDLPAPSAGDWRLVGEEGFLDVHLTDALAVRVRGANGNTEKRYATVAGGDSPTDRAVAALVDALEADRCPGRSARRALAAAEVVFAGDESVHRRGPVSLPLDREDDSIESTRDAGTPGPQPSDD